MTNMVSYAGIPFLFLLTRWGCLFLCRACSVPCTSDSHLPSYSLAGNSDVSSASVEVVASMRGFSDITIGAYTMRGPAGARHTRRYSGTLPDAWFAAAREVGSIVTVRSSLASVGPSDGGLDSRDGDTGGDSQSATLAVYGLPSWSAARPASAGIHTYVTADAEGAVPAAMMREGDTFYIQLYAHTGKQDLSSFEAKVVEDNSVCEMVPASGVWTSDYTGEVEGELNGDYQVELLNRVQNPADVTEYFTKYSRFGRLDTLASNFGHIGCKRSPPDQTCLRVACVVHDAPRTQSSF